METSNDTLPIDRGWAWVVLVSSFIYALLQAGTLRCFGLFFIQFINEFQSNVSETAVINSVQSAVYALMTIPVLTVFVKHFSERQITMIGCILTTTGYAISSTAQSLHFLIFSISILVGGGGALGFGPVFVILGKYFDKRRGLANGVMVSGSCVGSLALPPLIQYFLDEYGLRGALLLTAGVYAHTIVFISLLRPESYYVKNEITFPEMIQNSTSAYENGKENVDNVEINLLHEQQNGISKTVEQNGGLTTSEPNLIGGKRTERKLRSKTMSESIDYRHEFQMSKNDFPHHLSNHSIILSSSLADVTWVNLPKDDETGNDHISVSNGTKLCDLSVLKQMEFTLFVAYYSFACVPGSLGYIFIPSFAKETGLSNEEIVIMLGILASSDFIGRISCGYLADLPTLRSPHILLVSQSIICITANCARFLNVFWHFYLFVFLFGLFSGMQYSLCAAMVSRILGMERFPTGFAITVLIHMFVLSGVSPLLGYIRDSTGSYNGSFHFLGCCSFAAVMLILLEPLARRYDRKRGNSY